MWLKFLPIGGEIGKKRFDHSIVKSLEKLSFSYKDIVPFDYNRVPVVPYKISGDLEPSDYINASFVSDVFTGANRKYIAAQVIRQWELCFG